MIYQTTNLVSVAGCDAYLQELNVELNDLNMRLSGLQSNMTTDTTVATFLPLQLAGAETKLASRQAQLAATTDESEQLALEMEINNLESKIIRLQMRQEGLTGVKQVDRQLDVAMIQYQIAATNEFITALETRKTELQTSGGAA
ncbi:MAG: hypothetical protein IPP69_12085 [Flavobacteriales bacterium]|nr:hypothetical protein [Flavobacteriales bacterium]